MFAVDSLPVRIGDDADASGEPEEEHRRGDNGGGGKEEAAATGEQGAEGSEDGCWCVCG